MYPYVDTYMYFHIYFVWELWMKHISRQGFICLLDIGLNDIKCGPAVKSPFMITWFFLLKHSEGYRSDFEPTRRCPLNFEIHWSCYKTPQYNGTACKKISRPFICTYKFSVILFSTSTHLAIMFSGVPYHVVHYSPNWFLKAIPYTAKWRLLSVQEISQVCKNGQVWTWIWLRFVTMLGIL